MMPTMLHKPNCLHVPELYEDEGAFLIWGDVEGAAGYELEYSADESFEEAATGMSWDSLDEGEGFFAAIDAAESWTAFEALPARGLAWYALECEDLTWDELDAKDMTWGDISWIPVRFTAYRGPGQEAAGQDLHQTWDDFERRDMSWNELDTHMENVLGSWDGFDEWLYFNGLSWDSADAKQLSWEQAEQMELTWEELDDYPADGGPHRGATIQVPFGSQCLWLRLRAYDGQGNTSAYLEARREPVVSYHEVSAVLEAGEELRVQMDGTAVQHFEGAEFTVLYNPESLQLETFAEQKEGKGALSRAMPGVFSNVPGKLRFACERELGPGQLWSGLLSRLRFMAKETGTAQLRLERRNHGSQRIV